LLAPALSSAKIAMPCRRSWPPLFSPLLAEVVLLTERTECRMFCPLLAEADLLTWVVNLTS
jgi:predicted membrane protein